MREYKDLQTKLIHSGEPQERPHGSVSMPIYQSSTYIYEGATSYHDIKYMRLSNSPNHEALHTKLAAIENAEDALVTASGMAAISSTLLTLLAAGDHLLMQPCVYGGTHTLITTDLADYGIGYSMFDPNDPSGWEALLTPTTRLIYVESISNPLMQVPLLKEVAAFAKRHGLISIIDSTFTSPVNFRPAEWGFDLIVHSATKYLNGHSDVIAGAVIGRHDLVHKILLRTNHLGGSLDTHACFLLHRGLKTLALRVSYQNQSAATLAAFLENHPAVAQVYYPGLASNPSHHVARELFDGYGGMLSFELKGGQKAADQMIQRLNLPLLAPSLGGTESLIIRPAIAVQAGLTPSEREAIGVSDGLVRFSTGLESSDELLADFTQALEPA